jgi:maltokinase
MMHPIEEGPPPTGLADLLPAYLGRQRWYAGSSQPDPASVSVVRSGTLPVAERASGHRLLWLVVEGEGARYQLLIGVRSLSETAEWLAGNESAVIGVCGEEQFYDATLDPELMRVYLEVMSDGQEQAKRVRPVGAEQSNTSLIYDDRVIVKVFRRLLDGPNPDVVVTTALAASGFEHVAAPVASWRQDDVDLAFAQQFLAGGSEGWALALTSLRDLYASQQADPGLAGGDWASEAARLGQMTAQMHLAMADAFGVDQQGLVASWGALIQSIEARLADLDQDQPGAASPDLIPPGLAASPDGAAGVDGTRAPAASRAGAAQSSLLELAQPTLERLRAVQEPGPAIRVHGDYHLGQVMRTDNGWYVLDFEGEPARPMEERLRLTSPFKDVTGMLRSFQYASRFALEERTSKDVDRLVPLAESWELRNRQAFLRGYYDTKGIDALLPQVDREAVRTAFELDKALYEVAYERAYRPAWVDIPLGALRSLLAGTAGSVAGETGAAATPDDEEDEDL